MEGLILLLVVVLILAAEFVNGWTDAPNAIATVISTRVLTPRVAVLSAILFNIIGALTGTAVATTIGTEILRPEAIDLTVIAASMIAIISWSTLAWYFGIPSSESHALIASLSGAGLAIAGPGVLLWEGWSKVLIGLLFSTFLGIGGGWILAKVIQVLFAEAPPRLYRKIFGRLQIFSAMLVALSHGSNDSQKFMGVLSLSLFLGGVFSSFTVPLWVIILCALTMGLGTSVGGLRIIKTMGFKIVHLETYQGFAAEAAASTMILTASFLGIPLSTTHTINTAIVGVGMAHHPHSVRWHIFLQIVLAWVLTFPICGCIGFAIAWLLKNL
jgi:PiT family inorganic phosphate transporter